MASLLQLVPKPVSNAIPDAEARELALDITQSFIVEAPAGSGKTGLLIQRFLKLLASSSVDDPAQVLAITFTRKATSEMLDRVLAQLASAASGTVPANAFDRATRFLAEAVLARDAQLGWDLLDHPLRLNIRTIDSISNEIASALPILSGSGGQSPTDDPGPLYTEAARRTVMLLGGVDAALSAALELLLLHRDGNLANCEALIASMLQTRDQWGELVPLSRSELDDRYLDEVILPRLDKALDLAICRTLTRLTTSIPSGILRRLSELASEMAQAEGYYGNPSPIALCLGWPMPPEEKAAHLDHWRVLVDLLLTQKGDFRAQKGIHKGTLKFQVERRHAQELNQIIDLMRDNEPLREILCGVRTLPPEQYPREQWPVTKALFHVLSRALAELQLVFAERGQCDFAEVGLLARTALRNDSALDDLSAASGNRLLHLLVDEMQDTSTGQYEFIQLLTRRWDGHSQTVFLVGDPKQSIYLFRQARVERFVQTLESGHLGDLPLTVLRLTANFRSQPQLVRAFNDDFSQIFSPESDPTQPELVSYQPAVAVRTGLGERVWHPASVPTGDPVAVRAQSIQHAQEMRAIIESWRAKPLPSGRSEPWKIAVLVRNRSHLGPIVAGLKQPAPTPFRATEIEPLAERLEILDLLALTRALLHPADRTAWLALLRGPACGLSFADLHRLAGQDDRSFAERNLFDLMNARGVELSEDGIARLQPFWKTIDAALKQRGRGRLSLSQSVQRTWHELGFAAVASNEALANADTFFQLLDKLEQPGATIDLAQLHENVARLYAAPSTDPNAIDLMTLHKAKGLEWDVVLVPELQRTSRNTSGALLEFLETNPEDLTTDQIAAGILAPIAGKGQATSQLNDWMRSIASAREAAERKRLFYVACTRAREELHLFAAPARRKDGTVSVVAASLLHAAWPAAEPRFAQPSSLIPMPSRYIDQPFDIAASAPVRTIQRIPTSHPGAPGLAPETRAPQPSQSFLRPEGSFAARAFGNAMHAFLERLAQRMASGATGAILLAELPTWMPRIAAVLRANGLAPAEVDRFAANILRGLSKTLGHPEGQWLLAPHPQAASESSLTSWRDEPATIRLDRTFLAGSAPLGPGSDHLWIIDYKTTTHGPDGLKAFLEQERQKYAPQLETYARELAGTHPIRLALFYPMLPHLIWWEA